MTFEAHRLHHLPPAAVAAAHVHLQVNPLHATPPWSHVSRSINGGSQQAIRPLRSQSMHTRRPSKLKLW